MEKQNRCLKWYQRQLLAPRAVKQCLHCQQDIPLSQHPGGVPKKYCSFRCKERARHKRERMQMTQEERYAVRAAAFARTKAKPDAYEKHLAAGRTARKSARDWLAAYKIQHGCVDCGYREHSAALQLDHEGAKTISIADARSSIARLKTEIERGQCKVRCANCHAIKTWERKQKRPVTVSVVDKIGRVGRGCE